VGRVALDAQLTGGAPKFIWPLMIPVEILGTFIKPVALAIRLFANMTAGHILMATLFMFVGLAFAAIDAIGGVLGVGLGVTVIIMSVIGAFAVYMLEIFVAFLQAFVFMFLTTVFIAQLSHHGDHEHEHAHDDDHAHDGSPQLATA
ncbi:MAG: F0F1 ATP synthase subunit A, partial [Planctomycetota bacterium]